ncbi:MAG: hypothetical protein J5994_04450 [Ruminococcus sp.]|nr:hypothetical protein [Ruminococcus sp.]
MELLALAAIIVVMIAIVAGTITVLKNVSDFYRERFRFSIWSGVFLFVLALFIVILSESISARGSSAYIVRIISTIFVAITIFNDIRLAGFGWGTLAVCIQILLSFCLLFIIIFALIAYIARRVFNARGSRFSPVFGIGVGMRGELHLLMHFLHL